MKPAGRRHRALSRAHPTPFPSQTTWGIRPAAAPRKREERDCVLGSAERPRGSNLAFLARNFHLQSQRPARAASRTAFSSHALSSARRALAAHSGYLRDLPAFIRGDRRASFPCIGSPELPLLSFWSLSLADRGGREPLAGTETHE